jgi:hypothetical protein
MSTRQAEVQFLVTVSVEAEPGGWGDRSLEDYAEVALRGANLRDAGFLDGFADLSAEAWVDSVERAS